MVFWAVICSNTTKRILSLNSLYRRYSTMATKKGLVLGAYEIGENEIKFTTAGNDFNQKTAGAFQTLFNCAGPNLKKGKSRIFYNLQDYQCVAVVGLGKPDVGFNEQEDINEARENIRIATSAGVSQLRDVGATTIDVDPCGSAEAAAEGAALKLFSFDTLKAEKSRKTPVLLNCYGNYGSSEEWERGLVLAEAQNFARILMETPANLMTPTIFAETVSSKLKQVNGVDVIARDKKWAQEQKMGSFLSVTAGSAQPPVFLELSYNRGRGDQAPLALVGKGVTFDAGGISLKPSAGMDLMRGDMGGAACTAATMWAIAKLGLKVNVKAFIPLCENLPSGSATKPGDVVTAMNGKTIQIDNTDAEGRLILADAICYAQTHNPAALVDMATLTGAICIALGASATGTYSTCSQMYNSIRQVGVETGDRMWRMPLWKIFSDMMTESQTADLNNISKTRDGGSCAAAAFLREFVTCEKWMHLDIAGVMENKDEVPYLGKGMSGRPTRTIVGFVEKFFKEQS